eukprot:338455_1
MATLRFKLLFVAAWAALTWTMLSFDFMHRLVYDNMSDNPDLLTVNSSQPTDVHSMSLSNIVNIRNQSNRIRIKVFVYVPTIKQIIQVAPQIYVHQISNPFLSIHGGNNITVFHPSIMDDQHISFSIQTTSKMLRWKRDNRHTQPKHCEYITTFKLFLNICYVYKGRHTKIATGSMVKDMMGCKCELDTKINISETDLWLKMRSAYSGEREAHFFALQPKPLDFKYNISISVQNIVRAHWSYGPVPSYMFIDFLNYYIAHGVDAFYLYDIWGDLSIRWDLSTWPWIDTMQDNQQVDIFIYNTLSCLEQFPLFRNGQYVQLFLEQVPRPRLHDFRTFQYALQIHSFYEKLLVSQWNVVIDLDEYIYIPKQDGRSYSIRDYLIPYLTEREHYIAEIKRYRMNDSVCVGDAKEWLNTVHIRGKHGDYMPKALYRTDMVGFYAVHWAFSKNETRNNVKVTRTQQKSVLSETIVYILHFRGMMNKDRCRYEFELDNIEQICEYINKEQCYLNNSNLFIHKENHVIDMDRNLSCTCDASYPEQRSPEPHHGSVTFNSLFFGSMSRTGKNKQMKANTNFGKKSVSFLIHKKKKLKKKRSEEHT